MHEPQLQVQKLIPVLVCVGTHSRKHLSYLDDHFNSLVHVISKVSSVLSPMHLRGTVDRNDGINRHALGMLRTTRHGVSSKRRPQCSRVTLPVLPVMKGIFGRESFHFLCSFAPLFRKLACAMSSVPAWFTASPKTKLCRNVCPVFSFISSP